MRKKRTGILIRARQAGRHLRAWMGQNLIRLVEKMMLDGCLDENTKARYQFKSP